MRRFLSLLLCLLLVSCSAALGETRLTVTGTGEVPVPADAAVITLGVNVRDKDAIRAQSRTNEIIAAVQQALTGEGLAPEAISTGYINLYPVYDYSGETEELLAYSASSTLAVRVTDLSLAGKVIDLAFGAGANNLEGISFSVTDDSAARSAALKQAVADAGAKAEILAEASGLKITGIELIQEGGSFVSGDTVNRFSAKDAGSGMPAEEATVIHGAQILVSASVTVTYLLE